MPDANCSPHRKQTDFCGLGFGFIGFLFAATLVFWVGVLRRFAINSSIGKRSIAFFGGIRFLFNCFSGTSSDAIDDFDGVLDFNDSGDSTSLSAGVAVVSMGSFVWASDDVLS